MTDDIALQAAAFRRLLAHLRGRSDVQNIDLMILAGFCRNCLADWYRDAANAEGAFGAYLATHPDGLFEDHLEPRLAQQ